MDFPDFSSSSCNSCTRCLQTECKYFSINCHSDANFFDQLINLFYYCQRNVHLDLAETLSSEIVKYNSQDKCYDYFMCHGQQVKTDSFLLCLNVSSFTFFLFLVSGTQIMSTESFSEGTRIYHSSR